MAELAQAAGTTKAQIQKLERGDRRLSLDWMERIARALNVKVSSLLPESEVEGAYSPSIRKALDLLTTIPEAQQLLFVQVAYEIFNLIRGAGQELLAELPGDPDLNGELLSTWSALAPEERMAALEAVRKTAKIKR